MPTLIMWNKTFIILALSFSQYLAFPMSEGIAAGSAVNQFFPSFMNAESININSSPNYVQQGRPTQSLSSVQNGTDTNEAENNGTNRTENVFSELPIKSGAFSASKVPEFLSQTYPNNIMSAITINASSMFPSIKFSGEPGMLGFGSQVPLQTIVPEKGPVLDDQYLPAFLRNLSENSISSFTYNQLANTGEVKTQTNYEIKQNSSSISKPLYTGYPGMLGTGEMFQNTDGIHVEPKAEKYENHTDGNANGKINNQHGYYGQGYGNNYILSKASVNSNNWNGEWPGKASIGGDWSGDWSEKWPKNDILDKTGKDSQMITKTTNSTKQPSTKIDWDGRWPGSTQKENSTTNLNGLGDLSETLAKILSLLNKIPIDFDTSPYKASQTSFSQTASGWKDDMKS